MVVSYKVFQDWVKSMTWISLLLTIAPYCLLTIHEIFSSNQDLRCNHEEECYYDDDDDDDDRCCYDD